LFQADPIQTLADVDYSRADTFGERACSLSRLISKGYKVPFGVVISTKVFKRFLNTLPGARRIENLVGTMTPDNLDEAAEEIQDILLGSPVPMPMANTIAEKLYELMDRIQKDRTLVLRTSPHVEDSARHVCFGRGVYFHLSDISNIIQTMKTCWASAYTRDVLSDLLEFGLPPDSVRIATIVEEMIHAKVSGVISAKKRNEETFKGLQIHIRSNWGTQVYEGDNGIFCDHVIVNEGKEGEPVETFVSYKEKITQIPENSQHAVVVENHPDKKQELSLTPENITVLIQLAKKIRRDFEIGYDVEFAFDHDDQLWVLDATPHSMHRYHRVGGRVPQPNVEI
jgi:pyruvate,water dikinase